MKVKVKFDQKAITDFLVRSAEKIVLGIVGIVFLWMLYSSLSRASGLGRSPTELQNEVRKSESALKGASVETPELEIKDYVKLANKGRERIEESPYQFVATWNPPLSDRKSPRTTPPLLTVQQLRTAVGVGAFRVVSQGGPVGTPRGLTPQPRTRPIESKGGGGRGFAAAGPMIDRAGAGEELRAKRWVVVTGLVPMEEQLTAYTQAFRSAVNYVPENDYPVYLGYLVQRLEVANASEAANPDWSKAKEFNSTKAIEDATKDWSQSGEVVAGEFIDQNLVFPLPPLVNRPWDDSVAHDPEIPLPKTDEAMQEPGGRFAPMGGKGDGGRFGRAGTPMIGKAGGFVAADAKGGRRDTMGGDGGVETPFGTIDAPGADQGRMEMETPAEAKPSPYRLFRFFDFDVEPGRHYVYRVCLALKNPNYLQKSSHLQKPELAKEAYLKTTWSDPTGAIVVPRDTRVFAVSVTPARGSNEPSGQIMASAWLLDKGQQLHKNFGVWRGQVANYFKETVDVSTVDFVSDATIVDMRGGERLPGPASNRQYAGGQFLIAEPDGTLRVHDELDDAAEREQIESATSAASTHGPAPSRGGGKGGGPLDAMEGVKGRGGKY